MIWLKCSLGGLLGPDPGTPTGRASVRGLPAMGGGGGTRPGCEAVLLGGAGQLKQQNPTPSPSGGPESKMKLSAGLLP